MDTTDQQDQPQADQNLITRLQAAQIKADRLKEHLGQALVNSDRITTWLADNWQGLVEKEEMARACQRALVYFPDDSPTADQISSAMVSQSEFLTQALHNVPGPEINLVHRHAQTHRLAATQAVIEMLSEYASETDNPESQDLGS